MVGNLDALGSDIASAVWLEDDFFGEDVEFFPKGVDGDKQTLVAAIDDSALEGTNEAVGDGRTLQEKSGHKERQSIIVELPTSANVSFPQRTDRPDLLKREDGTMWTAKRLLASDSATKKVLFVRGRTSTHRQRQRTG